MTETPANGRVLQVNVSPGGVPKRAVAEAFVGPLGLDGDRHRDDTVHGGPHRAVCLFAIEAIRRVAGESHPISPGSVGENLTTEGVEWSLLPTGTRAAVGRDVMLEVSAPANPCDTIVDSFRDGRSGRISVLRFPSDSRVYARVLATGTVRPGDEIRVLPPLRDSSAETHRLLDLLESVERHAYLALWAALAATGTAVATIDDGDLTAGTCPAVPASAFNRAFGHRLLPNLLDRLLDLYRTNGSVGWVVAAREPWPGAVPLDGGSDVFEAPIDSIPERARDRDGIAVRAVGLTEAAVWADIAVEGYGLRGAEAAAWRALAPHLATARGEHLLLAERATERGAVPVGAAALFTHRRVGLLAAATVIRAERGRGVHGAMIDARARLARDAGCTRLMATADPGGPSERNLRRFGLQRRWQRRLWRFDPATDRPFPGA
jgi:MOSC domain-containing protein YiiM